MISWSNLIWIGPLLAIASAQGKTMDLSQVKTLFTFGDSYTTQYLDLSTMTYGCANCTSAGGPNWVEYFSDMNKMGYWDLAYNSAPVSNSLVGQNSSSVIDVTTQITKLFPEHFNTALWRPYTSLFTVWVGINDIDLTYDWKNTTELDSQIAKALGGLLQDLYEHRARQFMVINVPPIDRAPIWTSKGSATAEIIRQRVHDFNTQLAALVQRLQQSTPGVYVLYDAWSTFTKILDHPSYFNFTNIDGYCPDWNNPTENHCDSMDKYFWVNDLHPTSRVHYLVAESMQAYLRQ